MPEDLIVPEGWKSTTLEATVRYPTPPPAKKRGKEKKPGLPYSLFRR